MMLAKDLRGMTLAVESHPKASVETELRISLAARVAIRYEKLDEETKNHE